MWFTFDFDGFFFFWAFPIQAVYNKLLPLYYPRSKEEERASLPLLPADIGNAEGEPVVPERQIRITEKPGSLEGETLLVWHLGFSMCSMCLVNKKVNKFYTQLKIPEPYANS